MQFTYTAKDQANKIQKGEIQASSEIEAGKILGSQKLFVLEITQAQEKKPLDFLSFMKKISLKDKIIFTKQLAMMVKGGLPLVEALGALNEQAENPNFAKAIAEIKSDVEGGSALSKALAKHKDIFSDLYISITVSGEKSGKLSEVLEKLADQLQKDYDLISRVKNAVTYPIVIVVALIGIMVLMMIFVVPQLKTIFKEMGVELPIFTRVLLGTSDFFVAYWYLALAAVIGLIFAWKALRKNDQFSLFIDRIKLRFRFLAS
jgi:type II secretory pathway component PulF